jgi:hypothetical protein
MLRTRRCDICKTRLAAKKGHGFVVNNGNSIICGDYRRHNRIKAGRKYYYGGEEENKEGQEVLNNVHG